MISFSNLTRSSLPNTAHNNSTSVSTILTAFSKLSTMSDWDTVTKIGTKARGGASGPRETTVKGRSQLNAAQRSGAVLGTEKKYTTGNLVR